MIASYGRWICVVRAVRTLLLIFMQCVAGIGAAAQSSAPLSAAPSQEASPPPAKRIQILVLTDTSVPLAVDYQSSGRRLRRNTVGSLGLAGALVNLGASSGERSKESLLLQETVGEFSRKPFLEKSVVSAFHAFGPYFEAVPPADPTLYKKTQIDFDKVQSDGYRYVLSIKEDFAGMTTAWEANTLSATSYLHFELFDAATKKQLGKASIRIVGAARRQFDAAMKDRSIFTGDYPSTAENAGFRIYGELNRRGHLHTMAEANGLGNEVPPLKAILEKYAKKFRIEPKLPEGWNKARGSSKFAVVLDPPNGDRKNLNITLIADLLVPELGQNVKDLDEYVAMITERIGEIGYPVDSIQPFDGLKLNQKHSAFMVDRPNGTGKEVMLFRVLEDHFVAVYSIVLLKDVDEFLKKYSADLEDIINNTQMITSAEK